MSKRHKIPAIGLERSTHHMISGLFNFFDMNRKPKLNWVFQRWDIGIRLPGKYHNGGCKRIETNGFRFPWVRWVIVLFQPHHSPKALWLFSMRFGPNA
jgi:hypothetical protein